MVVATTLWRAFDKTVRRKPLAFAADAVYGNSIDLELEAVAKKGVARKALLLMFGWLISIHIDGIIEK